jgi:hypothetical protein
MRRTSTARWLVPALGAALAVTLVPAMPASAAPASAQAGGGVRAGSLASGAAAVRGSALVPAAAVRTYTVDLVLLRSTKGARNRTTLAQLKAGIRSTDAFYAKATGGLVRFTVGRTKGWSRTSVRCSPAATARIARKLGWGGSARRLVLGYQAQRCGFAGVAQLPGRFSLLAKGAGTMAMAHELGHNLGLWHSSLSRCSLAFTKRCSATNDARRSVEYGDATDLMGGGETQGRSSRFVVRSLRGTLNPWHMRRLGAAMPVTRIDLESVTSPVSVTHQPRVDRVGWNALSLEWGGRTFLLSFLAGSGVRHPYEGRINWVFPPAKGQVVVHGSVGGRSLLVPPTRSLTAGPGLADGAVRVIGDRTLRVRLQGGAAVVTISPS